MQIETLDILIILAYLGISVGIGFYISKRASKNLQSYFLGGNNIPWYVLGVSNASGMFDISGVMWTVAICFVYGLKSAWIPWLWPVWNQVFVMVFLAIWLRRSGAMTGAEWLSTRFGNNKGQQLSHIVVVAFAVISVIGFIAYGFKGVGKFATIFFSYDLSFSLGDTIISSPDAYALIIIGITTLYVVKGGMYSVVGTEILQFLLMTFACFAIGYVVMTQVNAEQINQSIPNGWKDLWFGWELELDWSDILPAVDNYIANDDFNLFGLVVMLMVFKGVFASLAGPVPSYDMQRILATKSPKEAAQMSGFTICVLYMPRYLMIAGLTVLGLVYFKPQLLQMGNDIDFEMILPYAINNFIPTGVLGLILAGLMAAFMSTFAAFVNAAPAYLVNDIYKKYINPNASAKKYIYMSYVASVTIVIIGVFVGFFIHSIDSITKWIVASLYGGYAAANVLKWIWWRFNGHGYFWGMIMGLLASMVVPKIFIGVFDLYLYPLILLISLAGCILGTLLTPPESDETLKNFYRKVRPWGFWKPIHQKIVEEDPGFQGNDQFWRDSFNVVVGIVWQMTMVIIPIYLVIREYFAMGISIALLIVCSFLLKKYWWNKLPEQ
ncbi:Na+:solute symporter [Fulvivirga sp. M361]|uniref:sodium:solute symporter family protein n=1 Tax=Fulvivirga sp. M361 TaxID=2594266 RepID=UPI00117BD98D|nr:sodium:solute symporter family protein [Fulvivirga sp. M361]TRX52190.1 Na+:solute symporter [Fulvivirga sp. M361]